MNDEDRLIAAAVPVADRAAEGIPDDGLVSARERARDLALAVLGDVMLPGGLRYSPLGPAWSRDLDAHVSRIPIGRLQKAGWLSLDRLLERVGSSARDRWGIVDDGTVIGSLDLTREPRPDPVAAVLARARGLGRVRVREMLELRVLERAGATLPVGDPVLVAAARREGSFGGKDLARFDDGTPVPEACGRPSARERAGRFRACLRPRIHVACSGVDGSGKTTLREKLAAQLDAAGVSTRTVWSRPGMGPAWVDKLARSLKRVLGQSPEPGVRAVAEGRGQQLRSRQGLIGSVWVIVVTLTFLWDVRRQQRGSAGSVVLWDRHVLDALATLDFVYAGVDLRVSRWLVRRLLPKADVTFYLDVRAEVAVARKPGDTLGAHAVIGQLEAYSRFLGDVAVVQLDAEADSSANACAAFRIVVGADQAP